MLSDAVKFVIWAGNEVFALLRARRRVEDGAVAAKDDAFDRIIKSWRVCAHLEVSAPGLTPPDADIFPRSPNDQHRDDE